MFNYRMQRRMARAQYRAYRRQMRAYYRGRGFYGGIGGAVWLLILGAILFSHYWFWWPLLLIGIPFFIFAMRSRASSMGATLNQPPYQQPTYQQMPPEYGYAQPHQPEENYQPYTQGYRPPQQMQQTDGPAPKDEPSYQYQERPLQQQYEEPLTMYPRE